MSLNKALLIGRLTKDPEHRKTPGGASVCNLLLVTNESWRDKGGQKVERAEFHRVVAWGKLADHCHQYLHKGSQCYIEGRLQTRTYEDEDAVTRYSTEVQASAVQFLDQRGKATEQSDDYGANPFGA